jgi:hypothetical protein
MQVQRYAASIDSSVLAWPLQIRVGKVITRPASARAAQLKCYLARFGPPLTPLKRPLH